MVHTSVIAWRFLSRIFKIFSVSLKIVPIFFDFLLTYDARAFPVFGDLLQVVFHTIPLLSLREASKHSGTPTISTFSHLPVSDSHKEYLVQVRNGNACKGFSNKNHHRITRTFEDYDERLGGAFITYHSGLEYILVCGIWRAGNK